MKRQYFIDNAITTKIMVVLIVLIFIIVFAFKDKVLQLSTEFAMKLDKSNVVHNDTIISNFNYEINNQQYTLTFLEFGATSCSACKAMELVLDEVRNDFANKVNVVFMNVTSSKGDKYADYFKVMMIPTQVVLNKEGQEIFRHTGYIDSKELEQVFVKNGLKINNK